MITPLFLAAALLGAPNPPIQAAPSSGQTASPDPGFQRLSKLDVRLDAVDVQRDRSVYVKVTLRNFTRSLQYITSGRFTVLMTDSEGVTHEENQIYSPASSPPNLFDATPVIAPGGQLQIRYVFHLQPGASVSELTISEGSSPPVKL